MKDDFEAVLACQAVSWSITVPLALVRQPAQQTLELILAKRSRSLLRE